MSGPARWLVRRLALSVLVVFGASTLAFFALHLVPGDPVRTMLGPTMSSPELVAQVRHDLGFDRPLAVQYGMFLGRLLQGDLGTSYQNQSSVSDLLTTQLGSTVELALAGFGIAFVAALALAVATAGRRPAVRRLSSLLELAATSSPSFWVGVLLLSLFSFRLRIFPIAGEGGPGALVLPAVTLALGMVGVFAQVMRDGMERALEEPFVLSARARGTGETRIRVRHALRHTMVQMVTLAGWSVGSLLTGAVIIETVFSRQGVGRVLATAIENRDLPVVTGIVVVSALVFALINLAVDGLYRVLDPRVGEVTA
ncbi:ABC transporter permease [Streptomyces sp. AK02-01A]|uniref:ABC transporter permease n=1 Tax=Streptomyces sp. AK02-01A TaxID=3028648 RepID=UPI0029B5AC33|nr:ABC transporter permease [Streptomyces sp. AK02-01A]MDX3854938.1 ABC transporter permease [Streptomyces sp. AK02-01A]